jgi:hypothetical protein
MIHLCHTNLSSMGFISVQAQPGGHFAPEEATHIRHRCLEVWLAAPRHKFPEIMSQAEAEMHRLAIAEEGEWAMV